MFCLQIHAHADCTMNEKFSILNEAKPSAVLKISSSLSWHTAITDVADYNSNTLPAQYAILLRKELKKH